MEERAALQAEIDQLRAEMERTATNTRFDSSNILDDNLRNAQFQIGAEASQIVTIPILPYINTTVIGTNALGFNTMNWINEDVQKSARFQLGPDDTQTVRFNIQTIDTTIGTNQLATINTNSIEAATHRQFLGNGFTTGAQGLGAAAASATGYAAETLTISHADIAKIKGTVTTGIAADTDAKTIAAPLTASGYIIASAFDKITICNLSTGTAFGAGAAISLRASSGITDVTLPNIFASAVPSTDAAALAINADAGMQAIGVYAVSYNNTLDIYATQGHRIILDYAATGTFDIASASNSGNNATVVMFAATASSYTRAGRVDVTLEQGYSITSGLNAANALFDTTTPTPLVFQSQQIPHSTPSIATSSSSSSSPTQTAPTTNAAPKPF